MKASLSEQLTYVMTLANSIIGVGVLAMPFCFQKCGIILSILMLLISGCISRLSCHFLLKAALLARRKNFEFLAFHTLGPTGKISVELGVIGFLMGTVIAFFVVVGDLGPQIIAKALDVKLTDTLRSWVMVIVSLSCVLPLGLLKNVDSLTTVCTATIGFYVCLVIKVMSESTEHITASDWQEKVELWRPSGLLQCIPIFSMALFCQTQIFEIYDTMPNPSLDKMNRIVRWAVAMCTAVYIFVGSFGYIAFCNETFSGNILMSFTPSMTSDIIKMGFVLSVAFSFPLVIFPCRSSLYSLLFRRVSHQHEPTSSIPERRFRCITVFIVATGLLIGIMLPSIEVVLGLVGSTMGVAVCVLLPALCYIQVSKPNTERLLAQFMIIAGLLIMILGTYANLYAMEEVTSGAFIVETVSDISNSKIDNQAFKAIHQLSDQHEDPPGQVLVKKKESFPIDNPLTDIFKVKKVIERKNNDDNRVEPPLPVDIEHEDVNGSVKSQSANVELEIKPLAGLQVGLENPKNTRHEYIVKGVETADDNNLKKTNEEISSDALKKEDQELALETTDKQIIDLPKVKLVDPIEMKKNQTLKIKKIEQENNALQKEFREKIIDMNLSNLNTNVDVDKNKKVEKSEAKSEDSKIIVNNKPQELYNKIAIDQVKRGILVPNELGTLQIDDNNKLKKSEIRADIVQTEQQIRPEQSVLNTKDHIGNNMVLKPDISQTKSNENIDAVKPKSVNPMEQNNQKLKTLEITEKENIESVKKGIMKSKLLVPIAITMSNNTMHYQQNISLQKIPEVNKIEDTKSHQRDILEAKSDEINIDGLTHDRSKREVKMDLNQKNCEKTDKNVPLENKIIFTNRLTNPLDAHNMMKQFVAEPINPLTIDLNSVKIINKNQKK